MGECLARIRGVFPDWLCRNVPAPNIAGSLICGCDLISANWLIGASDTDDMATHVHVERIEERSCGKKKGTKGTYTRYNVLRGRKSFVFVLETHRLNSDFLLYSHPSLCHFFFWIIVLPFLVQSIFNFLHLISFNLSNFNLLLLNYVFSYLL